MPFVLRREALSLTNTLSSENNRSPRLSLNLLSVAFIPRSVANDLSFWLLAYSTVAGSIKSPSGRDGHVLSIKDISVLLPSVN